MDNLRAATPAHVAVRRVASETVLLNLETGVYHGLDVLGSDFLSALEDHRTLAAASRALARSYGVSCDRTYEDLERFCRQMADRGLLELSGG